VSAVDSELEATRQSLATMGRSPALLRGDTRAFYDEARNEVAAHSEWSAVILTDAGGRLIFKTILPFGSTDGRIIDPASLARTIRSDASSVSLLPGVLMLSQQMPFAAVARIVGESAYRCMEVCNRYVEMALRLADFSGLTALAIDETSRARGHAYVTLAADAQGRRVIFVTDGRDAKTIEALAIDLLAHGCPPERITSVSIDMSPAFIKGMGSELPNAQITFDKFHVVGHANATVDKTRRIEQRSDKSLKRMRWTLLKDGRPRVGPRVPGSCRKLNPTRSTSRKTPPMGVFRLSPPCEQPGSSDCH
jgi:hypothetical protein